MRDMHTAAPQPPVPARAALPGWARDLIAAVVVLATTLGPLHRFTLALPPLAFVIAGVSAAAMFARRRYPWAVLVVCVVCFVVASFTLTPTPFSALATGIAVLTIATRHRRRTTLLTVLAVLAVLVPASALHEHESTRPLTILVVAIVGLFAAVGDATRSHRAYIDQITQRALDAEQTREVVASRRVAEDRLRIARDLHDAVAHQMSVINLHAGVATRTIDNDAEAAKAAVAIVGDAARRVLSDIGDLLSHLRAGDAGPTAGLGQISDLIARFDASGLRVTMHVEGTLPSLPPAADHATYRLLQEALTNAHKHGAAPEADVTITHDGDRVRIVITNPATEDADGPNPPEGHGLRGIREQVSAVGGTVTVDRTPGRFRVEAVLPAGPSAPAGIDPEGPA